MLLIHSLIVSLHFMFVCLKLYRTFVWYFTKLKNKKVEKKCLMTDVDWKLSRVILVADIILFVSTDLFQI